MKRTKNDTRIVLLGGRVFPALMNTLTDAENIKKLIPLTTRQSRYTVQDFQNALSENLKQKCILLDDPYIEAEDIKAVENKLSNIVNAEKGPIAIDITACPKIPALAAWELARKSDLSIIYVSAYSANIFRFNFKDGRYTIDKNKRLRLTKVKDYLSLYGRKIRNNFNIKWLRIAKPEEETAYEIGRYLISQKEYGVKFLKFFRCIANKKGKNDYLMVTALDGGNCKKHLPKDKNEVKKFGEIFDFLQGKRVIKNLKFDLPHNISFDIYTQNQSFLNGKWLDYYVYRILKDSGLFYDCDYSVGIPSDNNTEIELDFIGIAQAKSINNWVYIVEGKTGKPERKKSGKDFDTLSAAAYLIGDKAVVKFFVIHEYVKNIDEQSKKNLENKAQELNINLVFADDLEKDDLIERFEKPKFQPI